MVKQLSTHEAEAFDLYMASALNGLLQGAATLSFAAINIENQALVQRDPVSKVLAEHAAEIADAAIAQRRLRLPR